VLKVGVPECDTFSAGRWHADHGWYAGQGAVCHMREDGQVSTRNKVLIALAGVLVLGSMLVTGVFSFLLAAPRKVLVVTLVQGAGEPTRERLKADCGPLPGVTVVRDQGDPDPQVQGRFPVRFDLRSTTGPQEAALEQCINRHGRDVRGFISEGDN
jgi:hypothetical protein